MALIDMFLSRAVKRGQLTLHRPGKPPATFGTPDPELGHIQLRFQDNGVAGRIVRNPALAAGEMYMDGRMTVDGDDIMGLVQLMKRNSAWEAGQNALQPSAFVRGFGAVKHRLDRINMERRSKQNVAHHYDLSARLYDLFLDADKQYSCAYYTDPDNSLEQAQSDKL
ncbi:MAG: SAM-dependent methyltransferase, partial [Sphingomonas sp.]